MAGVRSERCDMLESECQHDGSLANAVLVGERMRHQSSGLMLFWLRQASARSRYAERTCIANGAESRMGKTTPRREQRTGK